MGILKSIQNRNNRMNTVDIRIEREPAITLIQSIGNTLPGQRKLYELVATNKHINHLTNTRATRYWVLQFIILHIALS